MSYYSRGSVAVQVERKPAVRSKRTVKVKSAIPTGEKLLYLLLIALIVIGTSFIGNRYVQISQYNHEIQKVKQDIADIKEDNGNLQIKIDQMNNQIVSEAQKMGMVQNPSVRILGNDKPVQAAGQN